MELEQEIACALNTSLAYIKNNKYPVSDTGCYCGGADTLSFWRNCDVSNYIDSMVTCIKTAKGIS